MNKEQLEAHIGKLNQAIEQSAANHNAMIGRREAYKEMLAMMVELELNSAEEVMAVMNEEETKPSDEPVADSA